jgi:hypothetical protein
MTMTGRSTPTRVGAVLAPRAGDRDTLGVAEAWMTRLPHSDSELVKGYFASYSDGGGEGPNFWAWEEMTEMIRSDPERAWRLTLEMLRTSSDPLYQAYVAAGPLEDLLNHYGEKFIDRIEALAKTERWFVESLCGVWGHMKPEIRARVQNAIESNT